MQHLDEGTIHSWLDGALSADEAARVEAHVKECPQCAAAVAEARGFIAGASRILTALDNAPRGVIPVAATRKRVDAIVWRVAATLLVVAAGTLVVVRNRGSNDQPMSAASDKATVPSQRTPVAEGTTATTGPATIAADAITAPRIAGGNAGKIDVSKKAAPSPSRPNVAVGDSAALPDVASEGVNQRMALSGAATAAGVAKGMAPVAPMAALSLNRAGALDAATDSQPLRIVGRSRRIGAKITLYEVAPGDTVTLTESLTESLNASLESVVVTGAATTASAQGAGKAVAAPLKARNVSPPVTPPDSQNDQRVLSAIVPAAASPTAQVGPVSGFNTIAWSDPAIGSTLTLTGRMSEARLKEIKIRIERERSAAAAAAKKSP